MSNEELTVSLLDKLGWDYDLIANPGHYKSTKDVLMGDLLLAIFNTSSTVEAAELLGISYKVVLTATTRFLVPVFGSLNGGGETWKWKFLVFLGLQYCSSCKGLITLESFDKDSRTSTGRHKYCKPCRKTINAVTYSKDSTKEAHKRSYIKHYGAIRNRNTKYRIERKHRVPKWSETTLIDSFYSECPKDSHVDHELPLRGELVSGLHVRGNLQYMTAKDNLSKGNRIDLDAYNKKHFGT